MRVRFLTGLCLAILISLFAGLINLTANATTKKVTLKDLNVEDVIYLPTTTAQREIRFTKPKSWKLSSNSYIDLSFQHSLLLLPNRSWLQILINDKVVKHIPLTKANAEATRMRVPLPIGELKDFNNLSFRVEQHYADRCEDPLDKSLWTQVLADTEIVLNYNSVLDDLDLAEYPYPIIDPLSYGETAIQYVVPKQMSESDLQALAYTNVHFGQSSHDNEMSTSIAFSGDADDGVSHQIYIGTPSSNSGIKRC